MLVIVKLSFIGKENPLTCLKTTGLEATYPSKKRKVEELGGYIDDGYLNGVFSVTRALGDWDMKLPKGSASPLITDPELRQILDQDDEFLIIGFDGIWDVLSSQEVVRLRCGLKRHDDPKLYAKELFMEALRLHTFVSLTVIVVCFSSWIIRENNQGPGLEDSGVASQLRPCLL